MKACDLICLENLSFDIFRAQELRYQGEIQYLKKPGSNRVKKQEIETFLIFKACNLFKAVDVGQRVLRKTTLRLPTK